MENLDKKLFPRRLALDIANLDFEKEARVFGGDSLDDLRPLGGAQTLFDYSAVVHLANRSLALPENRCRYFKVALDNFAETKAEPLKEVVSQSDGAVLTEKRVLNTEPLRLDGATFHAQTEVDARDEPVETPRPVAFSRKDEDGASVLLVSGSREPLLGFELLAGSANFVRDVRVLCSNDQKEWRLIANGRVSSLEHRGQRDVQTTLRLSECRAKHYKIEILNQDSPPLELKGLKAIGCTYRCVLLAGECSGKNLSLLFGGEDVPPPRYDLGAVLEGLVKPVAAVATLGEAKPNPKFNPAATPGGFDSKTVFFVVVLLVVLILAFRPLPKRGQDRVRRRLSHSVVFIAALRTAMGQTCLLPPASSQPLERQPVSASLTLPVAAT